MNKFKQVEALLKLAKTLVVGAGDARKLYFACILAITKANYVVSDSADDKLGELLEQLVASGEIYREASPSGEGGAGDEGGADGPPYG